VISEEPVKPLKGRKNRFKRKLDNTRSSSVISHKPAKSEQTSLKLGALNLEIVAEKIGKKNKRLTGANVKVVSPRR
jgi:hypothetical protein